MPGLEWYHGLEVETEHRGGLGCSLEALTVLCVQGVYGFQVSEADVRALGGLACDLPGKFVAKSPEVLLPWLAGCRGSLDPGQEKAVREALRSGRAPYG